MRRVREASGVINSILNDAKAKNDLELAQRAYGSLIRILAQDCQGNSSKILTILKEKGFDVAEEDVLADFVMGVLPAHDLLHRAQKTISSIIESMGFETPEGTKVVKDPRGTYQGIPYAPSLVPDISGNQNITSLDKAISIALTPGKKVFIVKNRAQMTAFAVAIQLELVRKFIQAFHRPYNIGTATGGTTETMRMVMGMPEYLRKYFDQSLNYDLLKFVATLDDYGWTPDNLTKAETKIGPREDFPYIYRDEQWDLWLKYILGDEERFISPGIGYENLEEAVSIFHKELEKLVFYVKFGV